MSPEFCTGINSNINFSKSGCLNWAGKQRKVWLDSGHYVPFPIFRWGGIPSMMKDLLAVSSGRGLRKGNNTKWAMSCKNPLCINPEHFIEVHKHSANSQLYPDYICDEEYIHKEYYHFYAISKDWSYGVCFKKFLQFCDYLKISSKIARRYLITRRLLHGKWILYQDRIESNYLDLEFNIPKGEEYV